MDPRLKRWSPVAEAITRLLAPHAEVGVHCPRTDRVLAIWNPFSGKRPGDPAGLGELGRLGGTGPGVYGPYPKVLPDGRRLSCVAAAAGDVVLSVHLDRSPLDQAVNLLLAFAAPVADRPEPLFEQDWAERICEIVAQFARDLGRPPSGFSREDRLVVLAELERLGVFRLRHAVPVVARALGVSRSTVYALTAYLRSS